MKARPNSSDRTVNMFTEESALLGVPIARGPAPRGVAHPWPVARVAAGNILANVLYCVHTEGFLVACKS